MLVNSRMLLALAAWASAACLFSSDPALAQANGCTMARVAGTARQIMRCADGVTITAEAGARFNVVDRNHDGRPDTVSLRNKAVLVDVDRARHPDGFEVVTPQAIAAVRGTRWVVDVKNGTTSVLVVRGRVAVGRPSAGAAARVVLNEGEGVDVAPGSAPLTVRRWPPARSAALLARLGQ